MVVWVAVRRRVDVFYLYNLCRIINFVFCLFMYIFFSLYCYISNWHHIFCIYLTLLQKQCFSEVPTFNIFYCKALPYRHSCEISSLRPVFITSAINVRFLKVGIFFYRITLLTAPPHLHSLFLEPLKPPHSIHYTYKHVMDVELCEN